MSSFTGQELQAFVIEAVRDYRLTNYSLQAALAFLTYDHFLHLPLEIQFVWKCRWTLGKLLYILTHYTGITLVLSYVIMANIVVTSNFCQYFLRIQVIMVVILIFLAGLILTARVYAAYGGNKSIFGVSLFFCGSASLCSLLITYLYLPEAASLSKIGLPGCYLSDYKLQFAMNSTPILVNEAVQLLLMATKACKMYRNSPGSRILRILIRDSVVIFVSVYFIVLANMLVWIYARKSISLICVGWLTAIRSALCGRILLNIRDISQEETPALTIRSFRSPMQTIAGRVVTPLEPSYPSHTQETKHSIISSSSRYSSTAATFGSSWDDRSDIGYWDDDLENGLNLKVSVEVETEIYYDPTAKGVSHSGDAVITGGSRWRYI